MHKNILRLHVWPIILKHTGNYGTQQYMSFPQFLVTNIYSLPTDGY